MSKNTCGDDELGPIEDWRLPVEPFPVFFYFENILFRFNFDLKFFDSVILFPSSNCRWRHFRHKSKSSFEILNSKCQKNNLFCYYSNMLFIAVAVEDDVFSAQVEFQFWKSKFKVSKNNILYVSPPTCCLLQSLLKITVQN
jgi:hypothetical protein